MANFPAIYKIINNLAMVPHLCLEKAVGRTRKKHNLKFWHISYNVDPYGQSFFPKCNNDNDFLIFKLCWIVIHGSFHLKSPKKSANLNGSDPDFDESAYI